MDIQDRLPTEKLNTPAPQSMTKRLRIDFVSDISCPWCVIGLQALEEALRRVGAAVAADLHFRPFELNPRMGAAGEDIADRLSKKYGTRPEQLLKNQDALRARGAELGFAFQRNKRRRIYNTLRCPQVAALG
jgi:predicted DsbA family dithiol-disulfide isomerase